MSGAGKYKLPIELASGVNLIGWLKEIQNNSRLYFQHSFKNCPIAYVALLLS